jgi:hypothetical protein
MEGYRHVRLGRSSQKMVLTKLFSLDSIFYATDEQPPQHGTVN